MMFGVSFHAGTIVVGLGMEYCGYSYIHVIAMLENFGAVTLNECDRNRLLSSSS